MSQCCHECGRGVENPFYDISLVQINKEAQGVAHSDKSCSLCRGCFDTISNFLIPEPPEGISLSVDEAEGRVGGFSGNVQGGGYETTGHFRYLNEEKARDLLSKCSVTLHNKVSWVEKKNGTWHAANWAT